jgi:hypothetical protein
VIFIEQKCGPHIEQKCAVLAGSAVYRVTLAQIEHGFVRQANYLGWSDPVCTGAPLPAGTRHPVA